MKKRNNDLDNAIMKSQLWDFAQIGCLTLIAVGILALIAFYT